MVRPRPYPGRQLLKGNAVVSRSDVKRALGAERWGRWRSRYAQVIGERWYRQQPTCQVKVGDFVIEVPTSHPSVTARQAQPLRDRAIGIIAAAVEQRHGPATIIDVGANVGDTAAIIASSARRSELVLVEPSDYFAALLQRNIEQLPNRCRVVRCLVGVADQGELRHWGGTAVFEPRSTGAVGYDVKRLDELGAGDVRLVKIDTDGYDFAIIESHGAWLGETGPALFYEVDCSTDSLLRQANRALDALERARYEHFAVWDDAGYLLLSTDDKGVVAQLHEYLHASRRGPGSLRISNFDVLAVTGDDVDVRDAVVADAAALQRSVPRDAPSADDRERFRARSMSGEASLDHPAVASDRVDIVVVSYQSGGTLAPCVEAVRAWEKVGDVIVVDNASTDDSVAVATELGARVIALPRNVGFGAGQNTGVAASRADWVLLLNPDAVVDVRGLDAGLGHLGEHDRVAMVEGAIRRSMDGELERWCGVEPRLRDLIARALRLRERIGDRRLQGLARRVGRPDYAAREVEEASEVEFIAAVAPLVRRRAFAEVGGFDETIFLYAEDTDLCRRLRTSGWSLVALPVPWARHLGGASSAGRDRLRSRLWWRSHRRFIQKHWRGPRRWVGLALATSMSMGRG